MYPYLLLIAFGGIFALLSLRQLLIIKWRCVTFVTYVCYFCIVTIAVTVTNSDGLVMQLCNVVCLSWRAAGSWAYGQGFRVWCVLAVHAGSTQQQPAMMCYDVLCGAQRTMTCLVCILFLHFVSLLAEGCNQIVTACYSCPSAPHSSALLIISNHAGGGVLNLQVAIPKWGSIRQYDQQPAWLNLNSSSRGRISSSR